LELSVPAIWIINYLSGLASPASTGSENDYFVRPVPHIGTDALTSIGSLHFGIRVDVNFASLVVKVGAISHQSEIFAGELAFAPSAPIVASDQIINRDHAIGV
jgi:hypothetical protein